MTNRIYLSLAVLVLPIGLAACGGDDNSTTPPTPVASTESKFGSCFATRFDAAPFSKATDPVPCPDLAPLSLTTKPNTI